MSDRKRFGAWKWLILVVGGIGVMGLAGAVLMGTLANRKWRDYAASLRAQGEALTFAEVDALRASIPNEENSALILEKLTDQLKAVPGFRTPESVLVFGRSDDDDFFTGLPQYRIQPSKDLLTKHQELLNSLEDLMPLKAGRFELGSDVTDPLARMVPNLVAFRNAGELVHLAAMMKLVDGKSTEAERFVVLQFRVASAVAENPTLVSRLAQISIHSMAVDSIEQMLRTGEISAANITVLDRELSAALAQSTMRWALLGDRAAFVESCEALVAGRYSKGVNQPFSGFRTLSTTGRILTTFARTNQLRGTEFYTRLVKLADETMPLLHEAQRVDVEVDHLGESHALTKMHFPSLVRTVQMHLMAIARLRSARVALAAERYRMTNARWPSSQEELVPQYLPSTVTDPFDDQPIRMTQNGDMLTAYSIGENMADDGGNVIQTKIEGTKRQHRPDIGFRLLPPEKRGVVILDVPPPEKEE